MRTLTLSTSSFDQVNTFHVATKRSKVRCSLKRDYKKEGDGIHWALNSGGCLKARYTDADRAETARLNADTGITHGESVLIDGLEHRCFVLGDYSNAAIFVLPSQWNEAEKIARL
jgi:hypothetical protein